MKCCYSFQFSFKILIFISNELQFRRSELGLLILFFVVGTREFVNHTLGVKVSTSDLNIIYLHWVCVGWVTVLRVLGSTHHILHGHVVVNIIRYRLHCERVLVYHRVTAATHDSHVALLAPVFAPRVLCDPLGRSVH